MGVGVHSARIEGLGTRLRLVLMKIEINTCPVL